MKLLANENFPLESVRYLQNQGFDVKYIGLDFQGILDIDVMALAQQEQRTILTFDRDYGELIFKYNLQPDKGVIYLRINEFDTLLPGTLIEQLLNQPEFSPDKCLTVIDERNIRQKKY